MIKVLAFVAGLLIPTATFNEREHPVISYTILDGYWTLVLSTDYDVCKIQRKIFHKPANGMETNCILYPYSEGLQLEYERERSLKKKD